MLFFLTQMYTHAQLFFTKQRTAFCKLLGFAKEPKTDHLDSFKVNHFRKQHSDSQLT